MSSIRINLLPHRELKKAARKQQFFAMLGIFTVAAAGVVFGGHIVLVTQLEGQDNRNGYLKKEIELLDRQIEEIKILKEKITEAKSRIDAIDKLQVNRSDAVKIFDAMPRLLPDGVYLKTLKQTGNQLTLAGLAQSNARVSTLMQNLDNSQVFEGSNLIEIRGTEVNKARISEFQMTVNLRRPKEVEKKVEKKADAPGAQPGKDKK